MAPQEAGQRGQTLNSRGLIKARILHDPAGYHSSSLKEGSKTHYVLGWDSLQYPTFLHRPPTPPTSTPPPARPRHSHRLPFAGRRGLWRALTLGAPLPLDITWELAPWADQGAAPKPRATHRESGAGPSQHPPALLTAPQVGGHVLQHLDLLDGLPPREVHHEHPVARGEVLQPEGGTGAAVPGRAPGEGAGRGPPAASVVSSRPRAMGSRWDPQALCLPIPLLLLSPFVCLLRDNLPG